MAAISVTPACSQATITDLGARSWPIWSCGVSRIPWTTDDQETCLGQVTIHPEAGEPLSIAAGDLVVFAKGLSCEWEVTAPVRKHYRFG